ncbi:MAG: family 14 glycosylhydrolase [Armatimonadia bacterium]|nr:family 14 glycosylhydrolase [Armatimonadia bacterium]
MPAVTILAAALMCLQPNPPLSVTLGETNLEEGLAVGSHGDGTNVPRWVAGRSARAVDREAGSALLYVDVADEYDPPGEVYITIEFQDLSGDLTLLYDARGGSAYSPAPDRVEQRGTGEWRQATFTLRGPGFENRQNGETDFRIGTTSELVVHRIVLTETPPPGYDPPPDPADYFVRRGPVAPPAGMDVIQQWQVHLPLHEAKLRPEPYRVAGDLGITSLQSYVTWRSIEPQAGQVDFGVYDPVVGQIRAHDVQWLPFIILGPYYATPEWWRSEHGVSCVSLERGDSLPIQSIWNPELRPAVERFLGLFAEHYGTESIEALNLGISGNWGESLMPAGGGFELHNHPVYKTHAGWWCGDDHARADWRRWAEEQYGDLDGVNAAWGTDYASVADIEPFVPAEAPSRRAAVDLVRWYTGSMTELAELWVSAARELYPDTPIYLCTGGAGEPYLGADFAAQAAMCARYGAGIRITNQGDDAAANFAVTRIVSSATRMYGGYYSTEPGGANTPDGVAGRVFDAVSGGASGVYFKTLITDPDRPSEQAVRLAESLDLLVPNRRELAVAALWPDSSIALDSSVLSRFLTRTAELRDALDFEFISEPMIRGGLLDGLDALVVVAGDTLEASTLSRIEEWVRGGGVLLAASESLPLRTVEGDVAPWCPEAPLEAPPMALVEPTDQPAVLVNIGGRDERFLSGAWHGPEGIRGGLPEQSFRWTAGPAELWIPRPAGEGPVAVGIDLAGPASAGRVTVSVNGRPLSEAPAAEGSLVAGVPGDLLDGSGVLRLRIDSELWQPPGDGDTRSLGVQVRSVRAAAGEEQDAVDASTLPLRLATDLRAEMGDALTQVGEGWVVTWSGEWWSFGAMLAKALTADAPTVPWPRLAEPMGDPVDGVLHCRVNGQVYSYNNTAEPKAVTLPGDRVIELDPWELLASDAP